LEKASLLIMPLSRFAPMSCTPSRVPRIARRHPKTMHEQRQCSNTGEELRKAQIGNSGNCHDG
jgi:hypothetical protein